MEGTDRPIWFAGDLDDSWVLAIAGALPRGARRLDCPGDLPDPWPAESPSVVVIHRATLTAGDARRLAILRNRTGPTPRVVLCFGPNARHADLERWARLVDVAIPEATASETVMRHALGPDREMRSGGRIAVVSANHELRATLADACRLGGYEPEAARDWLEADPGIAAVWDVPVLEAGWPERLAERAKGSPVVALLGFADRAMVRQAREHGASACLELPCEVEDLIVALDRVAGRPVGDPAHEVPPAPMGKSAVARRQKT